MQDELEPQQPELSPELTADPAAHAPAEPVAPAAEPTSDGEREGAMAKADLYKLASYSHKLFKQMHDDDELEAWVQAKITKAADYIASVYHYLEYEMKFSEYGHALDNSDVLSESQKSELKSRLMEAKMKIKELKKNQAEKAKDKKEALDESSFTEVCSACGGAGHVAKEIPDHVKSKVEKYNRQAKAMHAATKRLDKNNNGIPDEDEGIEEGWDDMVKHGQEVAKSKGTGKFDKKEIKPGVTQYTRKSSTFTDGGDDSDTKKAKKKSKEVAEGKKKGDGNLANNAKPYDKVTRGDVIAGRLGKDEKGGKAVKEALKGGQKKLDKNHNGKLDGDDFAKLRSEKKVDEAAKPSAGLSKEKKSAVVKKAKAGGDIGKPGKSFDKVAKAAGGGKKGKKIAAAAMWKNIKKEAKEQVAKEGSIQNGVWVASPDKGVPAPSGDPEGVPSSKKPATKPTTTKPTTTKAAVAESADMSRMREQMARLNQHENIIVKESSEVDQLRALTKKLLG